MVDETILLRTRITGHFQRSLSKGRLSESPLLDLLCASTFCERDGCFLLLGFGCENIFFFIFLSYYIFHLFIWNKYGFYKIYSTNCWPVLASLGQKFLLIFVVFQRQPSLH